MHGTTSNSALPHGKYPYSVQQHFPLYRSVSVLPYCYFGQATPGGISARFPTALHPPAALWRKRERLLIPINVLYEGAIILTKELNFVKSFPEKSTLLYH